uniref:Peroxisomal ATPase PEX1 n=2 Tax=Chromera velia TaxID=505693 RepID=A0A2K8DNV5_9ALVE|nr:Peroxisome biogenesis factor 1 [Chromera velia]|eukprot:Cvel_11638.t1-p1 / transcript=Cvel_11638.t1 / gene=Cvel_11638 / organism=Chromera_velia_CCMP2878 / gene_product=Peroxisome biogenesis factor 1, putative / transcript_product=Peroxisome biogenesis factor 1, putative / location=Cvel_scaffold737:17257-25423(-) / protein_length=1547 / sequence_SO=supercontig / SO=protein_coding / is_pseudo=false
MAAVPLVVRTVPERCCYVGLHSRTAKRLLGDGPSVSLHFCQVLRIRDVRSDKERDLFVGFRGAPLDSAVGPAASLEALQISREFCECLGLRDGSEVLVSVEPAEPHNLAPSVELNPRGSDDWEVISLQADYVERNLLDQIAVLTPGMVFPLWVLGSHPVFMSVGSLNYGSSSQKIASTFVLLSRNTELHVAAKDRRRPEVGGVLAIAGNGGGSRCVHSRCRVFPLTDFERDSGRPEREEAGWVGKVHPSTLAFTVGTLCHTVKRFSVAAGGQKKEKEWGGSVKSDGVMGGGLLGSGEGERGELVWVTAGRARRAKAKGQTGLVWVEYSDSVPFGCVELPEAFRVVYGLPVGSEAFLSGVGSQPAVLPPSVTLTPLRLRGEKSKVKRDEETAGERQEGGQQLSADERRQVLFAFLQWARKVTGDGKALKALPLWEGAVIPAFSLSSSASEIFPGPPARLSQAEEAQNSDESDYGDLYDESDSEEKVHEESEKQVKEENEEDEEDDGWDGVHKPSRSLLRQVISHNTARKTGVLKQTRRPATSPSPNAVAPERTLQLWRPIPSDSSSDSVSFDALLVSFGPRPPVPSQGSEKPLSTLESSSRAATGSDVNGGLDGPSRKWLARLAALPGLASPVSVALRRVSPASTEEEEPKKGKSKKHSAEKEKSAMGSLNLRFPPFMLFSPKLLSSPQHAAACPSFACAPLILHVSSSDSADTHTQRKTHASTLLLESRDRHLAVPPSAWVFSRNPGPLSLPPTGRILQALATKGNGGPSAHAVADLCALADVGALEVIDTGQSGGGSGVFSVGSFECLGSSYTDPVGAVRETFGSALHLAEDEMRRGGRDLDGTVPPSLLLGGPTGSGKTALVRALLEEAAQEWGAVCFVVHCRLLASENVRYASLETLLISVFAAAKLRFPSVVLLDDLDSLCGRVEEGAPQQGIAEERSVFVGETLAEIIGRTLGSCGGGICRGSLRGSPAIVGICESIDRLNSRLLAPGVFFRTTSVRPLSSPVRLGFLIGRLRERGEHVKVLGSTLERDESARRQTIAGTEGFVLADLAGLVRSLEFEFQGGATEEGEKETGSHSDLSREVLLRVLGEFTPRALQGQKFLKSSVCWSDVGGLAEAKQALVEILELPLKFSFIFEALPVTLRQGAMLIGPPGCGKTLIANAAAHESGMRVIGVKGPELLSKYIGASEQGVRDLFARARQASPCVVFFDELEALAPKRGADSTGVTDRVVNQLLCYLDGVEDKGDVFCLAASSRPDLVDPALLRPGRFDRICYCGIPSRDEKEEILRITAAKSPIPVDSDVNFGSLADRMPPQFTPADVQAVVSSAQLLALHTLSEGAREGEGGNSEGGPTGSDPAAASQPSAPSETQPAEREKEVLSGKEKKMKIHIGQEELDKALSSSRPSLSPQEVRRFHEICAPFLSKPQLESISASLPPEFCPRDRRGLSSRERDREDGRGGPGSGGDRRKSRRSRLLASLLSGQEALRKADERGGPEKRTEGSSVESLEEQLQNVAGALLEEMQLGEGGSPTQHQDGNQREHQKVALA